VILMRRYRKRKRRSELSAAFDMINFIDYFCRKFCFCVFVIIEQCVKIVQREIFKVLVATDVEFCVL